MITTIQTNIGFTLQDFLNLPETKPASEFINNKIYQKSMPQFHHSRIQGKLCQAINQIAEEKKIALAFPELRCIFAHQSIVPDISVIRWKRIPIDEKGRLKPRFNSYPDWVIEILSPDQSTTQVLAKLLLCSRQGTELGWLINPDEETVLIVFPEQKVNIIEGTGIIPVLENIDLKLTPENIFSWLKFPDYQS